MAMSLRLVVVLVAVASPVPGQTMWYVDDDACPGPGSGSQGDPFCRIQDGIAAASGGDTVLVLPGTYFESIDFLGKAIEVKSSGGAAATVIVGDGVTGAGVTPVVTFANGEGRDSLLEGFTITGGGLFTTVAGILCWSSPTIRANIIKENSGYDGAGGIISTANALIVQNVFLDNGATFSTGGMSLSGTTVAEDNWIEGNASGYHVGGMSCFGNSVLRRNTIVGNWTACGLVGGVLCGGNARLEDNRILRNTYTIDALIGGVLCSGDCVLEGNEIADNQGGILAGGADDDQPTLLNNLICGNAGGGITCDGGQLSLVNNTIHGNGPGNAAGGITCYYGGMVTVANSILWNDQGSSAPEIAAIGTGAIVDLSWSDVEGGQASVFSSAGGSVQWGPGMIDSDPLFVDPDGLDDDPATIDDNDFHVVAISPCVDSADNDAPQLPAEDFEGDPRPVDVPGTPDTGNGTPPLADMGFDEFHSHLYFNGDATPGGGVALIVTSLPFGSPVIVWFAVGALDPPLSTNLGFWHLAPPLFPLFLPPIPADGIDSVFGHLPSTPPAPYTIYSQAVIGSIPALTNLAVLAIE